MADGRSRTDPEVGWVVVAVEPSARQLRERESNAEGEPGKGWQRSTQSLSSDKCRAAHSGKEGA